MNPAERLLSIYNTLVQQQKDQSMTDTWAVVFDLDKGPHLEDEVTACLVALRQQVDFTRTRLSEHGVPVELTRPGFDRLKAISSPSQLNAGWSNHRGNIQAPECRHAFTWSAWVLREEAESEMPAEELSALRAEIDALEQGLESTEMSPYLRDFIKRQIATIKAALRVYGVQGVRPVHDALRNVAGAYTIEKPHIEHEYRKATEAEKGLLSKMGAAIQKTAEVCDNLDKIKKFGEGAWSLATSVAPLVLSHIK